MGFILRLIVTANEELYIWTLIVACVNIENQKKYSPQLLTSYPSCIVDTQIENILSFSSTEICFIPKYEEHPELFYYGFDITTVFKNTFLVKEIKSWRNVSYKFIPEKDKKDYIYQQKMKKN